MTKQKTLTEKIRENPFILSTIFLGVIVLILIVGTGFNEYIEKTPSLVDSLILNGVTFVYSSNCPACQNQIEIFGDEWKRYFDSGLTIDCNTQQHNYCNNISGVPSWLDMNGNIIGTGVINNEQTN